MVTSLLTVFFFFPVLLHISTVNAISFQIPRFSPAVSSISYRGDAAASVGAIQLNTLTYLTRVGQAIYSDPILIWDSNTSEVTNFTTHFTFQIDTRGAAPLSYGHGLVFFLAPVDFEIPPNSAGGFLGLFNTSFMDSYRNQMVCVEFDSYPNTGTDGWDPNYEHVGINVNSIGSKTTAPWNASLHELEIADVWVVYNSSTQNLTVHWSYGSNPNTSLSYPVNLKEILPERVMAGFSAATGANTESHALYSWEWDSDLDGKAAVKGRKKSSTGLITGLSVAGGSVVILGGLILIMVLRKHGKHSSQKNKDVMGLLNSSLNDDLERGAGPKRFSYKDLASATNNFSCERKLGEGGCGEVYKGDLLDMNISVAVKKFSRSSKQGKKQYVTEVKIISSLRHRNLVQLIGWCHDNSEFLLVYEYMPNGSLDSHLFSKKNNIPPLSWGLRYKIALGLASGLLYLHEEWEQCVVHRDIKSSNIMLDSGFNVKLGDFGLAKFMDHELGPQTTGLAGTFGYLAPEYISTGRASKESDVYSFGIVSLEIVTGRKSVDPMPKDDDSETGLLDYVWGLYGMGKLASVVDEKLKDEFDVKQVECLLTVGLWCGHPDPSLRPSIRQAIQVLHFDSALPKLPTKMPVPTYPQLGFGSSNSEPTATFSSADIGR